MLMDLNELDDQEKQLLLQYLQDEYEKHPDQFPFPKEHLNQIIQQENFEQLRDQIRILQQPKNNSQTEDEKAENIQIEGGEQQIEDEEY